MTEDRKYFVGPLAVAAFRAGGGDPGLPGVPLAEQCACHWDLDGELMAQYRIYGADGISLAALADAGYTVDMSKAIPWSNMARDGAVPVSAVEAVTDLVLEPDSTWRSGHRPPFKR